MMKNKYNNLLFGWKEKLEDWKNNLYKFIIMTNIRRLEDKLEAIYKLEVSGSGIGLLFVYIRRLEK